MKLTEARQIANHQMDMINDRRHHIQKLLKEQKQSGGANFDRVELSKELDALDKAYEETFQERERINAVGSAVHNAEVSKQQTEAEIKAAKERMKCMEIFRRIAQGDKVPPQDEKKLMEFDSKMYMAAKNMALLHVADEHEVHDSLWGDEEKEKESPDAHEVAENTEVELSLPDVPAAGPSAAAE